jgi:hypothetical protein
MVDAGSISAFSTREETSEPDRRTDKDVLCGRGVQFVVGEVNCPHGRDASARAKASGLRAGKAYAKIDEAAKSLRRPLVKATATASLRVNTGKSFTLASSRGALKKITVPSDHSLQLVVDSNGLRVVVWAFGGLRQDEPDDD